METADEQSAGALLWQGVRARYENPSQNLKALADEVGMPCITLSMEAKNRGWTLRSKKPKPRAQVKAPIVSTRATLQRFKDLLQSRLGQLENQLSELGQDISTIANERDIRATNILVRTLEKVLELERKDKSLRARKAAERRHLNDAERDELAQRIARLPPEPDVDALRGVAGNVAGDGDVARLALLGEAGPAPAG
jgi:DNA-binding transcriptional MerR regulator